MTIRDIIINHRQKHPVCGVVSDGFTLVFFQTASVIRIDKNECRYPEKTVMLYDKASPKFYRSTNESALILDYVEYDSTEFDKSFFSQLNIPVNKPFSISETAVIRNIFSCMQTESSRGGKLKNEFLDYALRLILINLNEQLRSTVNSKCDIPHYSELKSIRESIYNSPMNKWSIDEICDNMSISRTYFHRIYFSAFGVTCMQDVINSRLNYAGNMLLNTQYSVSRIAEFCGYDSDSYFMRQFKKHMGYTPSEFRKKFSAQTPAVKF